MKLKLEELRILGRKLLVRKYERPERVGSIWLNPAWRQENNRALWELVKSSDGANEFLGFELEPNSILVTPPRRGVHVSAVELPPREDGSSVEAFFVLAEEIVQIMPPTPEWEDG